MAGLVGRLAGLGVADVDCFPAWQSGRGTGMLESRERLRVHGEPGTSPDLRQEALGDLAGGEADLPSPSPPTSAVACLGGPPELPSPLQTGWVSVRPGLSPDCFSVIPGLLPRAAQGPASHVQRPAGCLFAVARRWARGAGELFSTPRMSVSPVGRPTPGPSVPRGAGQAGSQGCLWPTAEAA